MKIENYGTLTLYLSGMKLTTKEAAARLKISQRQVQTLIQRGRIPFEKIGRDLFIEEKDLNLKSVQVRKKTGRPKKNAEK